VRFAKLIQYLEQKPGIYMMLCQETPIYIGKAKNLRNRLKQYFQSKPSSYRIQVMLSQVDDLQVIVTDNEANALILENKLIKEHQPKYNIMLKDDKSYPYLVFSKHDFPRLMMIRSKKLSQKGKYYGPYVNQKHAILLLEQMQKVFLTRNCSDHFYRNRMRPCMQYEINRCRAPCVGYVSKADYQKDIYDAKQFLEGRGKQQSIILDKMNAFSKDELFEQAAFCRDLLQSIGSSVKHAFNSFDIFYREVLGSQVIIVLISVNDDQIQNVHIDTLDTQKRCYDDSWLEQYVYHYYSQFPLPKRIILPEKNQQLEAALGVKIQGLNEKKYEKWTVIAQENLQIYFKNQSNKSFHWPEFWKSLELYLSLSIENVLCVDVSHHQGSSAYASCVSCLSSGMDKSNYRTYKVKPGGDDCAAIFEVVSKIQKDRLSEKTLLIIDGGKGQIGAAKKALDERGIKVILVSVSKGKERIWGDEKFYKFDQVAAEFHWPDDLLKYILHIRDEAHDFAITMHRRALRKLSLSSVFDQILGIGDEKKKRLLAYFGGLDALKCAKLEEIEKVPGIGPSLAKRIYDTLHIAS